MPHTISAALNTLRIATHAWVSPAVTFSTIIGSGAGVICTHPVPSGTTLVKVHHSHVVRHTDGEVDVSQFHKLSLAAALLREEVYCDALGEAPHNGVMLLPKHFETEEYKVLCKGWRELAEQLSHETGVSVVRSRWALSHVLSRAVVLDKEPVLLPLLDLANHSFTPNARFALDGDDACLITTSPIESEEVTIQYSDTKPDTPGGIDFWRFTWGFIPET